MIQRPKLTLGAGRFFESKKFFWGPQNRFSEVKKKFSNLSIEKKFFKILEAKKFSFFDFLGPKKKIFSKMKNLKFFFFFRKNFSAEGFWGGPFSANIGPYASGNMSVRCKMGWRSRIWCWCALLMPAPPLKTPKIDIFDPLKSTFLYFRDGKWLSDLVSATKVVELGEFYHPCEGIGKRIDFPPSMHFAKKKEKYPPQHLSFSP